MRRREFITLLGAMATWPLAAHAQQPAIPVIGFLSSASADRYAYLVRASRKGLSEAGYVDGQNVLIEYRWADGQYERLPTLAADLVQRRVNVIAANSPAAVAAKAVTASIPIVFDSGSDPVKLGLVGTLSRPGGNVTGVSNLNLEIGPKRLELLRELLPTSTVFALLVNPANPGAANFTKDLQNAASMLAVELLILHARSDDEITTAFATLGQRRVSGLVISTDPFFISRGGQLGQMALRQAVPAIFEYRDFAAAGGLMSYGGNPTESYRLMGVYTSRVLKGEKPADLPVQQATKLELIINLKAAKALAVTVPPSVISRADEVIE